MDGIPIQVSLLKTPKSADVPCDAFMYIILDEKSNHYSTFSTVKTELIGLDLNVPIVLVVPPLFAQAGKISWAEEEKLQVCSSNLEGIQELIRAHRRIHMDRLSSPHDYHNSGESSSASAASAVAHHKCILQ